MQYVYTSRTGNVQTMIDKLGIQALQINDGSELVEDNYILFTYTDGYGDIPFEVETFLSNNSKYLKGVIASGDLGYGDAYCLAGDKIANEYGVDCLYKVENMGSAEDYINIKTILENV
ncbi:MAG: class Ib ribonucleoside-diphosphate reductase assembly flavoprotein NrdI [Erysipelotrichaceae bacterium]